MKKNLTAVLTATTVAGMMTVSACAEEVKAFVSISDNEGQLVLPYKEVSVKDINEDGKFDINEALSAAHSQYYEGASPESAYASSETEYGISMDMLWGTDNGGSYGYYLNDGSALSLGDEIKSGDHVYAYCYTDLSAWSDIYCYFDKKNVSGKEFTLTLNAAAWDENYNPITVPVTGAVITVDGEKTDFVTDAEGKVTISADKEGGFIISAVSDTQVLVPPVCIAAAKEQETKENPTTGVSLNIAGVMLAAAAVLTVRKRK